jgi:hypothetical protein
LCNMSRLLAKLVLEWQLYVSMEFSIMKHWVKMNILSMKTIIDGE